MSLLVLVLGASELCAQNVNLNSYYRLNSQYAVGKSLAVRLTGDSSTAQLVMAPTNPADPYQLWAIERFDSVLVFTNHALGRTWALALDSSNFRLTMEPRSLGAADQDWTTAPLEDGFQIRNKAVAGRSIESTLEVPRMDPSAALTGQKWFFNLADAIAEPTNISGTVRIRNRWKGTYIFESNGTVSAGALSTGDTRGHWQVKHTTGAGAYDTKTFVIENKATGRWLNMESRALAASTPCVACVSARWFVEPVSDQISTAAGGPWWRLSNAWEEAKTAAIQTQTSDLETGLMGAPGWFSAQWAFEVLPSVQMSCNPATGPARAGTAYVTTCTVSGGVAPYSFSSTQLPTGLAGGQPSPTTATISGTPTTAGPYQFTVFGRDSATPQQQASVVFTGTIAPASNPVQFSCNPTTGPLQVGVAYSSTCTVSGGVAPYTFTNTQLPAGLIYTQTAPTIAVISGTPTAAGPYDFTVFGRDASSPPQQASVNFKGTIAPAGTPMQFTCNPLRGPTRVGLAYTSTCTVSGGVAPYTFTTTQPPAGLIYTQTTATTAVISGTPTTAGTYDFTVFGRDASSPPQQGSVNFKGTIATSVTALTITPATLPNAVLGALYNAKLTASGGAEPYAFSLSSGTLPQGLTLASDGTIRGTPSQLVPFPSTFTLRVTDASGLSATQQYTLVVQGALSITIVKSASDFGGGYDFFAAGSWIEIKGGGFAANTRTWQGSDFDGAQGPTSLDGVRVTVNGKPAVLYYLSPGQINAQAPADDSVGPVVVKVLNSTGEATLTVQKRQAAPAVLAPSSFNVGGRQYLVAQFKDLTFVGRVGLLSGVGFRPAKPGEEITVYGVGFGDVTPAIGPGTVVSVFNTIAVPLSVRFGQTEATTLYKGLAQGFLGLYQFNIRVPEVPDGDHQIHFTLDGQALPQPPVFLTVQR